MPKTFEEEAREILEELLDFVFSHHPPNEISRQILLAELEKKKDQALSQLNALKPKIDELEIKEIIRSVLDYPVYRVCAFCGKSPVDWDEECFGKTHESVLDNLAHAITLKKEFWLK